MTETDTRVVEQTIRIEARPETVWRYWTDPELLREWWGTTTASDPGPGDGYRIEMGSGQVVGGEFLELVPHERIVFSFGWEPGDGLPAIPVGSSQVEVTLVAEGSDTILTLRHSRIPAGYAGEHGEGWARHLALLAAQIGQGAT